MENLKIIYFKKKNSEFRFNNLPIIKYYKILQILKEKSKNIKTNYDTIHFANYVKEQFSFLCKDLELPRNHFSINTTGEAIIVKERKGEHVIAPTHFETGAYFSHPHADHDLYLTAKELPKIQIGRYVRFGKNSGINAGGNVIIEDGAWLSPGAYLLKQNHDPYGRPSVCARTVSMTKLPNIHLAQYAWVGREAMVGWDSDYIGKCSIVATRSFINSWVSDYTIRGMHGRIIQYLPYKAALMEFFSPTIEEILKIRDWQFVQQTWLKHYYSYQKYKSFFMPSILKNLINDLPKNSKILSINYLYDDILIYSATKGIYVDIITKERIKFPYILQNIQNTKINNVRLRGDVNTDFLPFPSASIHSLSHKSIGYNLVISFLTDKDFSNKIKEISRVSLIGANIVFVFEEIENEFALIKLAKELNLKYISSNIEKHENKQQLNFIHFIKEYHKNQIVNLDTIQLPNSKEMYL